MTAPADEAPQESPTRVRSARSEVAAVFIGVAVITLLLAGLYNYVAGSRLLDDAVETSLTNVAASRGDRIEEGLASLRLTVTVLAAEEGVRTALDDLSSGFGALDETLTPGEEQELLAFYEAGIPDVVPPGLDVPPSGELVPESEQARYLQHRYLATNPADLGDRSDLEVADDSSDYGQAHAEHHSQLRALAETFGYGDLILIDASGNVVYSVDKRIDFATNLANGPHRDSSLGTVVVDELGSTAPAGAVFADFQPYLPSRGAPTLFVVAPVRDESGVAGAVAAEVTVDALDEITTAGGDWEGTGLGDTGEVYVVGPDSLMRSDSRLWLEDPQRYLADVEAAGYPDDVAAAVDAFGTTALIQPVDTEAVAAALAGDPFMGRGDNYLGVETLSTASLLDSQGLGWVVVAELATAEANESVGEFQRRLLLLAIVLLPLVAAAGVFLARRLLRPVDAVGTAASAVGDGDRTVTLPADGRDEFGELGGRFNTMVAALRHQESRLAQADVEATELLSSVLPAHLVEQVKHGDTDIAEAVRNVTLIAFLIDAPEGESALAPEALQDARVEVSAAINEIADRYEAYHVHTSAAQVLFATGLRTPPAEASSAIRFAVSAAATVAETADRHGVTLQLRTGLAAGDVMAGVVGTERMTYDLWGEPLRVATRLARLAEPAQILTDASVVAGAPDADARQVRGLVDGNGAAVDAWRIAPV